MKAVGIALVLVGFSLLACAGGVAEEATPSEAAPTMPPSGAEVGVGTYKVGDTVSFSSHSLTVNSFERNDLA